MKLHEAIQQHHQNGNWFRPAAWSGTGYAHIVSEGNVCQVPGKRGAALGITPNADDLSGDWECVEPDTVLAEREATWKHCN